MDAALDAGTVCARDTDCDDGLFCSGVERCRPGDEGVDARGCLAGSNPCGPSEECIERSSSCRPVDCVTADRDGDGHDSIPCGGNDCDDDDPLSFPGLEELCDLARDEDCNPVTVAGPEGDMDGDGFFDMACCNASRCGGDCDDRNPNIHPAAPELCNALDDDCDGVIDGADAYCPVGTCSGMRCRAVDWERVVGTPGLDIIRTVDGDSRGRVHVIVVPAEAIDLNMDGTDERPGTGHLLTFSAEGRLLGLLPNLGLVNATRSSPDGSMLALLAGTRVTILTTDDGSVTRTIDLGTPAGFASHVLVDLDWTSEGIFVGAQLDRGTTGLGAIWLVRLDELGTELASRIFDEPSGQQVFKSVRGNGNGLVIVGSTNVAYDIGGEVVSGDFVLRLDADLASVWSVAVPARMAAISRSGDVAVVGRFDVPFDPPWGETTWTPADQDAHVVLFDSSGLHRWTRLQQGAGADYFITAAFDERGGVLVAGYFSGVMDVTPRGLFSASGVGDGVYALLGVADGFVLDARQFAGSGGASVSRVRVDPYGGLIVVGSFSGEAVLVSGTRYTAVGGDDGFLVRAADL